MESAADPDARPKLPSISDVLEDISSKRKSVGCSCEVLAKKVKKYYLEIDPNYEELGISFYPCCALCCSCHSDRFDEEMHMIGRN